MRLCARCLGYFIGFITPFFILEYYKINFLRFLDPNVQQIACILFALPLTLDWVTQSWGMRKSNNWIRLVTGILMGVDALLFSKLEGSPQIRIFLFVSVALSVTFLGYFGKLKRQHRIQSLE